MSQPSRAFVPKPSFLIRVLLLSALALPGQAQLPSGWSGADIGNIASGSENYSNGVYTVTGSGWGMDQRGDEIHFVYKTLPAGGNFRLTVRVASFNGIAGSEAGLAVRKATGPLDSTGAVAYCPLSGPGGTNPNAFANYTRDNEERALYPWRKHGWRSPLAAPCWLQIVRYGNNYAVYKSSDAQFWALVDASGGAFSVVGPIEVGMYVSSGGTSTATATFDSVKLETNPVLPYETSWLGNTFSSDATSCASGMTTSMWVAPDGGCYTSSFWDEGGENIKEYKDGKVIHVSHLGGGIVPSEGSITGDGTHIYCMGLLNPRDAGLYQIEMDDPTNAKARPMHVQTPLINPKNNASMLSGLAYGNGELYLSNSLTSQILVVDPTLTGYGEVPFAETLFVNQPIDTSKVPNPAPQLVYQTALQTDILEQIIPNLTAGRTYTVRLHFAEIVPADAGVGKRVVDLQVGNQTHAAYDIYADAGALNKATVVSFSSVTPEPDGKLQIWLKPQANSPHREALLCGIEILNPDGTPVEKINCGGGAMGDWKSTIQEIPSRAFSFTRPGPIAVDKNGNLWIVQEGTTFPASAHFTSTPGWAAIKLYDKNGHYLDKQITDVVDPTALSYDSASDHLLVAENGPDQNIRIYNVYTGTTTTPACTGTFGVKGGVFAGKTPGLIHDPESGGDARFFGPTGVGMDARGNIYVACDAGSHETDLRAFSPDGKMVWNVKGLEFCNVGDFDPTVGASDVWTATHHYTMDYHGSTAGGEWKLKSYLTNPFAAYSFPSNLASGNAVYRKIGKTAILYTAGQGVLGPIYLYRFSGEQIIPCGSFTDGDHSTTSIWIDSNGDGIQQPDEMANATQSPDSHIDSTAGTLSFDVDNNGNIYLARGGKFATHPNIQKFALQGFDSHGVPLYSRSYTAVAAPPPFDVNWGNQPRLRYLGGPLDSMYLLGETKPMADLTDHNYGGTLACYDHWSTKPTKRFVTVLPTPADNPNFQNSAPPFNGDENFCYMAFDVANGISFITDFWGTIHVVDAQGKPRFNMIPGPENSGLNGWTDQDMGLRAHYNAATGEYDILQEIGGERTRQNFYRWNGSWPPAQSASDE